MSFVPVTHVVDRTLDLAIYHPELSVALAELDSTGDGTVNIDDVATNQGYLPDELKRDILHHSVVRVLEEQGFITTLAQKNGMLRFFDLYVDITEAREVVKSWKNRSTESWGRELEVDKDTWDRSVKPHISGTGVLSVQGSHFTPAGSMRDDKIYLFGYGVGLGLSAELYYVVSNLSGKQTEKVPSLGNGCGLVNEFSYDQNNVPRFIKSKFDEMMGLYKGARDLLDGYREVECDNDRSVECSSGDESPRIFLIPANAGTSFKVGKGSCR